MRSIVGWGVLPLALACSFDPTGVGTMAPATTADSDPGDATDTTGVDVGTSTTGVPTTEAATSTGEPEVTSEPVTTGPTTGGPVTSEPATSEPATTTGTTDDSTSTGSTGDDSTTEPDTTTGPPETTGPPPCGQSFYKEVVLAADATLTAPMATAVSNMGEGTIAYSGVADMGVASFSFELECEDEVAVWGRVLDVNPGSNMMNDPDSYWVRADDGAETGWFYGCLTIGQPTGYHWLRMTSAMANQPCNTAKPWTLNLPEGSHTIHLRNREAAGNQTVAAVARVLITNDLDYVPVAPE